MKAVKLTSHAASMDLMVEFPGNGMVPRERFRPIPQLLMRTATEQRAEQLMAHGQVVQDLQHVDQYGNRHGEQNNRLQRAHHLEWLDESNWNELTRSARRDLET